MAGEAGGGGFLGAIAGIGVSIASFLKGFFSITAKELVRLITYLKNALVEVSQKLLDAVWAAGKGLWKALRSVGLLAYHGLKRGLLWTARKLAQLEAFLKAKLKPILDWLAKVKLHLREFWNRFIRPILDVIDFIRQVNRVLQIFHIDVLRKLDSTLAQIEQKIEEPFLFVWRHITELENWLNRIVTLDGLFQRLTLIRSLASYAPDWINGFYNRQLDPSKLPQPGHPSTQRYPLEAVEINGRELGKSYEGKDNRMRESVDVLVPLWRIAAGLDPPTDLAP